MRVEWTASAVADLESVVEFYEALDADAAAGIVEPILRSVTRLEQLPYLGVESRDLAPLGRYRHLVQGRYRVIYRVDEAQQVVFIVRVWDTRQDPHRLESGE